MTPASAPRSFLARVRDALGSLHPAERRLGEFVCDFPGELASYNAQELASLANVSKATVSRFVRRLGYASYEDARRHAREEQKTGSRLFLSLPGDDAPEAHMAANLEQAKANLDRTYAAIAPAEVDDMVRELLAAHRIWVVGFRAGHPFAAYLRWQLLQVHDGVVTLPGAGETLGEHLASVGDRDCAIVFGLRRRVSRMPQIVQSLAAAGARVLYVTDEGAEPEKAARWHFRCHTAAPGPLFNHVAVMSLCHLIAMRAIELAGGAARVRLRAIETLNDTLDEL
ncbi:MurR/RpiR family transcriptional regulator [Verticiella sediminum]|uniref:MurR/RpiR family transcriptional regulator n=1 Tax=Verticiella sediminum TaxID=1247510 RepID=A0A556ANJ1_9BURK|nr:MurR/RpiR family transcriptional regulator [Verticiella sediminum]TSH94448.1 MurR/RpiR family transcriptional regulator [Verticiella sediminum]